MRTLTTKVKKRVVGNLAPNYLSHTLVKCMIAQLNSNTIIVRFKKLSPERFYQIVWLLEQLELYGFDSVEDAIRSHIDSRYWND